MDVWLGSMPAAVMQNTPLPERRTVTPPFALDITGDSDELVDEADARAVPAAPCSARGACSTCVDRPGRPGAGPS